MHIVEQLIAERAQKLMKRPRLWSALRPLVYKACGYKQARAMADDVANLSGRDAFGYVSDLLSVSPQITGAEHIPTSGPVIIISNHPTGLADGVYVFDALRTIRPNHIFMANADAIRVVPAAEDIIIPVEWVKEKRTSAKARKTLLALKSALQNNKAVVIFPSGVLGKLTFSGIKDQPWNPTALSVARKNNIPIVPLRIKSRNSLLYYFFSKLNNELRDITLFHELLNKKGQSPKLTFGPVIDPATLPRKAKEATQMVRKIVENL